jgi:putative transposase
VPSEREGMTVEKHLCAEKNTWRNKEMLSYRLRIYPSKTAQEKLVKQLELCRWLYNRLLEELNRAKTEGRKITPLETQALIVKFKEEKPELKEVYSKVLQMVNYQLWSNIRALSGLKEKWRRVGRLRFKGCGWFKTLNFNQSGFKLRCKKLVLSKIGEIPIKLHRETKGEIKGVIVKRESSGKWFAVFQVKNKYEPQPCGEDPRLLLGQVPLDAILQG